ncbi:MAG: SMP-30/gluconolactonase/LRE family protein [bacterium]
MKVLLRLLVLLLALIVLYFLFWPVPIQPVAWKSPANPGYTGPFAPNERLSDMELLPLGGLHAPESVALDQQGRIYVSTHEGWILRLQPDGTRPEKWAQSGGRPLGITFDSEGNLIVADSFRGLLSISTEGKVKKLASECDGIPILYADDVDVAADGKIYFTDASTKFGARQYGGTYEASLLDLMEHGGHGRLLVYDPSTGKTTTLLKGLNFANGVAVSHDQKSVLINETGSYRVIRFWLEGPKKGKAETLVDGLPGFPDNITAGMEGRYWVALASPRNPLLDALSDKPFLRKVVQRLPAFARPKAQAYGHIIALDDMGKVVEDLQDPAGRYPVNTSVRETKDYLYIGSLAASALARVSKAKVGL